MTPPLADCKAASKSTLFRANAARPLEPPGTPGGGCRRVTPGTPREERRATSPGRGGRVRGRATAAAATTGDVMAALILPQFSCDIFRAAGDPPAVVGMPAAAGGGGSSRGFLVSQAGSSDSKSAPTVGNAPSFCSGDAPSDEAPCGDASSGDAAALARVGLMAGPAPVSSHLGRDGAPSRCSMPTFTLRLESSSAAPARMSADRATGGTTVAAAAASAGCAAILTDLRAASFSSLTDLRTASFW